MMLEEKLKKEHMPFKPTTKHSDLPNREVSSNASSNNDRSFLERVESQLENRKKKEAQHGLNLVPGNDILSKEYTFKPKVTSKAQNHRSRTGTEMSRDHQWFETKRRVKKFKKEKQDLEKNTFRPQLQNSEVSRRVHSKIKITSEPESYLNRIKRESE